MRRDSRLSTSLHLLLHMAERQEPSTSEFLAECLKTNPVVIRRTMAGLREAGLVQSEKGHGGGWKINRDLRQITLRDIYRALDEPVLIQQEQHYPHPGCAVAASVQNALSATYQQAEKLILKRFDEVTLADLSADFHKRLTEHHSKHKHAKSRKESK